VARPDVLEGVKVKSLVLAGLTGASFLNDVGVAMMVLFANAFGA
jgi:hypothetical protein